MGTIVDRNYNETEVVFGNAPAGTPEETKNACSNINWVRNDINEIKSQFIKLGFHLEEISRCEIYKVFGFDDFYEFCEANFHLSRSTVSRHINLFLRFCHRNGKYETPTMFIDERWKDYSYSQLCEMLPLPDWKLCDIKPEMTIAQIREYKAGLKNKACATSHKTCDAKAFSKTCDGCFYQLNPGCPFPEEREPEPEAVVCDVAQEENHKCIVDCQQPEIDEQGKKYLDELSPIIRQNFEALESLGYILDVSVVRDAKYIRDCVDEIKRVSECIWKYIAVENYEQAYYSCLDMLYGLIDLVR